MATLLRCAPGAALALVCAGCICWNERVCRVDHVTVSSQFFGNLGIWGHDNQFTVRPGSRLEKISIWGNRSVVEVADGVTLYKVEFFGRDNLVILPVGLDVKTSELGTNRIVRRCAPAEAAAPTP
jgi:hypothetical protein